ncbi:MAG: thioesterase family protein [Desulforegulaceae bacterium]|nr:thioesterase family protein [Desulforegulaceae bacterium]
MEPEIKIRGYHTDFYNHVNNARYLEFLEEGRWQLFEDYLSGSEFATGQYLFYVVNINISYLGQAKIDDIVVVKSGMLRFGNKSAAFRQQVVNKKTNQVVADAEVTFVIAGTEGKALKIDGEIKELLSKIPPFKN